MKVLLTSLLVALTLIPIARSEIIPGQAVSWTDFSHITCIGMGYEFVFFGTTEGILRYHRFERQWYDPITVSDGMQGRRIDRIAVSPDDELITVETENGIYTYDGMLEEWRPDIDFPADYYRDSRPGLPLPMLIMPFGYTMSPKGYISDEYFRDYQVTAYFDDGFNNIFIGTWGMGPVFADNRDFRIDLAPYGLLQKTTDAIYIDGDSLWLAGNAGDYSGEFSPPRLGVTLFDRGSGEFTYFEPRFIYGFDSEIIYDISGDKDNVYFAGRQGLTVLDRSDDQFFTLVRGDGLPSNETTAVAARNDSVWIGTTAGLALYTPSVDTMVIIGRKTLGDLMITGLEIVDDKLIIGTVKGAYYINVKTREIGRLRDPEGNLGGIIYDISTNDSELLISSDWGLTSINMKTGKSEPVPYVSTARGVYAAAGNGKYIAAADDDGLVLIERKTKKYRRFTEDDGLLSLDINAMVPDGDYLWLGSEEGLTRFMWVNPDRVD